MTTKTGLKPDVTSNPLTWWEWSLLAPMMHRRTPGGARAPHGPRRTPRTPRGELARANPSSGEMGSVLVPMMHRRMPSGARTPHGPRQTPRAPNGELARASEGAPTNEGRGAHATRTPTNAASARTMRRLAPHRGERAHVGLGQGGRGASPHTAEQGELAPTCQMPPDPAQSRSDDDERRMTP